MKVAVIGSRTIKGLDIGPYMPRETTQIISGGAQGVDSLAAAFAKEHHIPLQVFLPNYQRYGRGAPFVRNRQIVDACNVLVALWDGASRGTSYTIAYARKQGKDVRVFRIGS